MTGIHRMLVIKGGQRAVGMDDQDKRDLGERFEPGGRPKAPGRVELLQRFLNTSNHELPAEWDRLGTAARARAWLREKGLVSARDSVTSTDAARLRELREALRALAVANQGSSLPAAAVAAVRRAARSATLRIGLDEIGRTSLAPAGTGVDAAAATLLGIVHEAQLAGDWPRLKGCRQCGYVFFDRSKNRSASWCAMAICGNRTKNRAYRRRHSTRIGLPAAASPKTGMLP
jgi:predicted RNA-binding Zn ribbon-like protein